MFHCKNSPAWWESPYLVQDIFHRSQGLFFPCFSILSSLTYCPTLLASSLPLPFKIQPPSLILSEAKADQKCSRPSCFLFILSLLCKFLYVHVPGHADGQITFVAFNIRTQITKLPARALDI